MGELFSLYGGGSSINKLNRPALLCFFPSPRSSGGMSYDGGGPSGIFFMSADIVCKKVVLWKSIQDFHPKKKDQNTLNQNSVFFNLTLLNILYTVNLP